MHPQELVAVQQMLCNKITERPVLDPKTFTKKLRSPKRTKNMKAYYEKQIPSVQCPRHHLFCDVLMNVCMNVCMSF